MWHSRDFIIRLLQYRNVQFWITLLGVLLLLLLFHRAAFFRTRWGKRLFWVACSLSALSIALMTGLYGTRLPRGLSGTYFANAAWQDDGTKLERFFDANGQRIDRFIDFQPNDFNNEYPFTGNAMSAQWHGRVYIPEDGYQLTIDTRNVSAWLQVDDTLMQGHHRIDFGTPEARALLREGWSHDEIWGGGAPFPFVWGLDDRSEFYLAFDEAVDARLIFRCAPFQRPGDPLQTISASIAGHSIGRVTLQEGWQTYTLTVPQQVLQQSTPGTLRVVFAYAHEVTQLQDPRPLRVAFDFAWLQKMTVPPAPSTDTRSMDILPLSQGLHTIDLKVLTNKTKDVRIGLLWHSADNAFPSVIPEDFLFPDTISPEAINSAFVRDRIWLGGSLCITLTSCLLLCSLLIWGALTSVDARAIVRQETLVPVGICAAAFVIRILFIFEMKRIDPTFDILPEGTDPLTYVIYARGFLRGFWPNLFHQPFHGAPLISFYLILCSILFGENLLFARLATAVLASATVWFTYKTAHQTFRQSRIIAYLAAGLCACNGVLIVYDTSLLIAPLLTFCSSVSLYLISKLRHNPSIQTGILAGVFLGLTVLARSNILLIMPFLGFWMLVAFSGTCTRKLGYYVVICLAMFLTILPVTIRNYYADEQHQVTLTSGNGGRMLWLSNNPAANGAGGFSGQVSEEVHQRIRTGQTTYTREVVQYIVNDPANFARLLWKKFVLFWRGYEIANLLPYYLIRANSRLLQLPWLNFVLIAPLGIVGMALAIKHWRASFILSSYILVQMATTLIFHALARYRIPVVPVLSIFAAYTLWDIGTRLRAKHWRQAGLVVGAVVALYFLINAPYAARLYQLHHETPMPWLYSLRYWDLFHTW